MALERTRMAQVRSFFWGRPCYSLTWSPVLEASRPFPEAFHMVKWHFIGGLDAYRIALRLTRVLFVDLDLNTWLDRGVIGVQGTGVPVYAWVKDQSRPGEGRSLIYMRGLHHPINRLTGIDKYFKRGEGGKSLGLRFSLRQYDKFSIIFKFRPYFNIVVLIQHIS